MRGQLHGEDGSDRPGASCFAYFHGSRVPVDGRAGGTALKPLLYPNSWALTPSPLFRSLFHSCHQISEPLPLLPFTFVFWFGLGSSYAPGDLT